ncbi:hypothetical protein CAF53_20960 [Sphingobium sp. LB126]|uniref:hypothetical protein n=1 Tax=Sphingobium sp. LB126 TaxID=1983755 RepID=UPI000C20CD5C|nr:hypothetical protein [Sphingobium sp. LB126]PJG46614.1 hypothetical protein CAF53_20960 [Sphingobium sp. LB126]
MSNLVVIDKNLVDRMLLLQVGRTDEALNDRFGISYNSWRKIMEGRPVRPSLADRLIKRIQSIDEDHHASISPSAEE